MHILGGLVLLALGIGVVFLISTSSALQPLSDVFSGAFGISNSTSTANNSEYYQQVRIQFVSLGAGLDQPMVVSLRAEGLADDGVVVSGWKLRTDRGTHTIPRAANIYSPSVEGVPPEDIYLRQGGVVNFYSTRNPQEDQPQAIRSGAAEWQIWLDEEFLTAPHGTIVLRDGKGKIVDRKEY